ncbi:hypothetical protein SAMN05421690_10484 [Nitrosomonas sp. Nm51]|uniref:hypothetical protein n=1 Tax=Nitrosomonas sp. Nm51 TaxID=133720 RepID=UPI0008CCCEE1|nr:hypothetical protein [Nitrosomonas sp. Nm51]SER64751.1 hypothetical protein SAMN05421690_10484 [Nitrosomonas sp. Nm51]
MTQNRKLSDDCLFSINPKKTIITKVAKLLFWLKPLLAYSTYGGFKPKADDNIILYTIHIVKILMICTLFAFLLTSNQALPNVFDDIKADMLLNEVELLDAPDHGWSKKGNIVMGAAARGDATPIWWQPYDKYYKSAAYWQAITPWFVIYPGTEHEATNARVKISDIKLFVLKRSTNSWEQINEDSTDPKWQYHMPYISSSTARQKVNKRIEPDGKISYKLNAGLNPIHGGIRIHQIDGADVKAVYAQLTSELILDDPESQDDRAKSQLLVSVGADYYPDIDLRVEDFAAPHKYVPTIGASRFGLAGRTPRIHHMATIDPPDSIKTGSKLPDTYKTISITEFEANPPVTEISPNEP